jgi:hypothetical protein
LSAAPPLLAKLAAVAPTHFKVASFHMLPFHYSSIAISLYCNIIQHPAILPAVAAILLLTSPPITFLEMDL